MENTEHGHLTCCLGKQMFNPVGVGGLPSSRQMGMCCWMGLHFHNWILNILGLHFYTSY